MKTRKGIYLDLKDSDYFYRIGDLKFYFSSQTYREKFIRRHTLYAKTEQRKIELRYSLFLPEKLFYFTIYSKIETRGFRVEKCNTRGKAIRTYNVTPTLDIELI